MKSERRHELQTNTLAFWLEHQLPELAQKHGAKILTAIIIVALGIILIRQRINDGNIRRENAQIELAMARGRLAELHSMGLSMLQARGNIDSANQLVDDLNTSYDKIVKIGLTAQDRHIQAQARVLGGDYQWLLGNFPEFSSDSTTATTRKARQFLTINRAAAFETAASAYDEVINKYSDQSLPATEARFGLAALAENKHNWDGAKKYYEQILNDQQVSGPYKEQARIRLNNLADLQKPVLLVLASQPAVPSTQSTAQPATGPVTNGQ